VILIPTSHHTLPLLTTPSHQVLPPQLTLPLIQVSSHLELPPVLTYAGANLWNFICSDSNFTDLDNLSTLCSFTGTESESWFFLISVAMEAKGGPIIRTMMKAIESLDTNLETVISALDDLRACISDISTLLGRMYERCDPMTFYHRLRPFLAGSKNMGPAGLPRGVFYDEGDGKGQWRQLMGGSNGQSSLIQFFDIVLGVDHKGSGNSAPLPGEKSFLAEVREYMPGPHRRFLARVARMGSIREIALRAPETDGGHRLREAYTAATEALSAFRSSHISIVTRYIVVPSQQPWAGTGQNLASSSSSGRAPQELTGTGGTCLLPFLKQSRDETAGAGQLE
jgi:indoleamine 2,3-dioxygenase